MRLKYRLFLLLGLISTSCNALIADIRAETPLSFDPNGQVLALFVFDDRLVAAGHFRAHVNDALATNIVSWDGEKWNRLGDGFNGPVYALAVYQNRLIAAGSFSLSGSQSLVTCPV